MPQDKNGEQRVTRDLLEQWPLPKPKDNGDKDDRGRVLVVGGEISLPGAVILAGIAALRAGAGKLQIASCESIAPAVGIAVPESLSLALAETKSGKIAASAAKKLRKHARNADAVLIGPGMTEGDDTVSFVRKLLASCTESRVVLDAGALSVLHDLHDALHSLNENAVITPHAGEMAQIMGEDIESITRNAPSVALDAAQLLQAVTILKGARTFIATPDGDLFCYESGDVGLATSGSGDTLAGVVAGLLARGTEPLHAALWAVYLHGSAGNALAKRMGRVGYLARELLAEIPPIMSSAH